MKAIGFHTPGDPDVLDVIELPDPVPGEGEVLIRVHAAAVNPTDLTGRTRQRRAGTAGGPYVLGMDAARVIEQIGPETQTDLRVGDRVMAIIVPRGSHGAYAERVAVPAESVAPMPSNTGFAEAATLPMNGLTARLALDRLGLDAGDVVAVTGAAGAMGGYAVQLAKADGLRVVADAAPQDEELVENRTMDQRTPEAASTRGMAVLMAGVAVLFLVVAIWKVSTGDLIEATGHGLLVLIAAAAAFLFSNPRLPATTQRRVTVGALALVPVILTILLVSFFL